MLRFIAGNNIDMAIKKSSNIIKNNKLPIINYIIENNKNKFDVYKEYIKINEKINNNYKIAIKLSSLDYDYELISSIIKKYKTNNIKIFLDAETSDQNDKYQKLSNCLIEEFNKDKVNIFKTYQMYRKDSYENLSNDIIKFKENNINMGVKLVRGAYFYNEKNNEQLFTNKEETDFNYNKSIIKLHNNNIYTVLATHNHESINLGLLLNNYKSNNCNKFEFAKLLDMNINKYNSIKYDNNVNVYIPYGPYKEMIPYLIRRLFENLDTIKYMIKLN